MPRFRDFLYVLILVFSLPSLSSALFYEWDPCFDSLDKLGERLQMPIVVTTTSEEGPSTESWANLSELIHQRELPTTQLLERLRAIFPSWTINVSEQVGKSYLNIVTFREERLSAATKRFKAKQIKLAAFEGTYVDLFKDVRHLQQWSYQWNDSSSSIRGYGKHPTYQISLPAQNATMPELLLGYLLQTTKQCHGVLVSFNYELWDDGTVVGELGLGSNAIRQD